MFLKNAILAAFFSAIVCGLTGSFIVLKRISFLAGGLAHSILGGVGIAKYLGFSPVLGALISAGIFSFILAFSKVYYSQGLDIVVSSLWSMGMALGIIFIYLTPGYGTDLMTYLFGDILLVGKTDIQNLMFLDFIVIVVIFSFFRQFVALSFDENHIKIRGISQFFLYLVLFLTISSTIVVLMKVVGLILVIAMLTLPSAISSLFAKSVSNSILIALFLSLIFMFLGLYISFQWNLPSGAIIVLVSGVVYFLAIIVKKIFIKTKKIQS